MEKQVLSSFYMFYLMLAYVTLVVPLRNIFFISGSLYDIGKLFLMTVCKFFIVGLYPITKLALSLCDLGLTCLAPLLRIMQAEQD